MAMAEPGQFTRRRTPLRWMLTGLALLTPLLAFAAPTSNTPAVVAVDDVRASRYVAITPVRVLDTRQPGFGSMQALDILSVDPLVPAVVSAAGVDPLDVEAVAVNLTITEPEQGGWLKTWPTADPTPELESASALNSRYANHTIANLSIVPVGANGRISIQSLRGTHVVVDVQGVFERSTSSSAGRFVPLADPQRAIDTRETTPVTGGSTLVVDLTTTVGVPRTASAALINLVAADTQVRGNLTAYPSGPHPNASNLNYPDGNANIAGSAITELDNGRLTVRATGTTDIIVDVIGYMTGETDEASSSGLFVPFEPERHYDSRSTSAGPLTTRQHRTLQIAGSRSVPATGVLGVASNLTMTNTDGRGFLVIYPKNPVPSNYSTMNAIVADQTVANHAVVALDDGELSVYSHNQADFVVDISGYFLDGSTVPEPVPQRVDTSPTPTPDIAQTPITQPDLHPNEQNFEYLQRANPDYFFEDGDNHAAYSRYGYEYYGWNPCEPITYAVNSQRATPLQMAALNEAIYDVEEATGFDFVYVGEATGSMHTDSVDPRTTTGRTAMALFGFSDPYETPILAGGTIGIGGLGAGIDARTAVTYEPGDQYAWIVRDGFAIADVTDVSDPYELQATFAHEIGHMIGLDHVNAFGELMRPVLTSQNTFGPGDKYGLWSLGADVCSAAPLSRSAPGGEVVGIDVIGWIAD